MKIRLTHNTGAWITGQVVDLPEGRARGLIHAGYAVAAEGTAKPEQAMEQSADGRGRPSRQKPESRG